jgi:CBS domain-containing protein
MKVRKRERMPARVSSLMKRGAPAVGPRHSLTDVADQMRRSQVSALAVMEDDHLTGIITERDVVRAVAAGLDPEVTTAAECMTQDPRTIAADQAASTAVERMIELGVRHLPVVEDGGVVGVISARDLLHLSRPLPRELLGYEPW